MTELGGFMLAHARRRTLLALAFLMLGSFTEGLGILVLVPLLQLIGPDAQTIVLPQLTRLLPSLFPTPPEVGLVLVLGVLLCLITLQALFNRWKSIHNAELLYDIVTLIRTTLFASIGRARWVYVSSIRGSDLQHSVTADIDRINAACFFLLMLVQDVVLLAAYLALSCLISPAMTGFAFVTGALTLLALHPIRRKAARYGELLTTNRQDQYRTVSEFLTGLKLAKSFNAEGRFLDDLTGTLSRIRTDFSTYLRLSSLGSVLTQVSGAVVLSIFVLVGLRVFKLQTAELIVLIYLFSRVSPRFAAIQGDLQELLVNLPAFASVRRLKAACDAERDEDGEAGPAPGLPQEMRFEVCLVT
ncbi:ABC transporter transmembrane domain-containing protein, partial [Nostoc sp. NIES-2111]